MNLKLIIKHSKNSYEYCIGGFDNQKAEAEKVIRFHRISEALLELLREEVSLYETIKLKVGLPADRERWLQRANQALGIASSRGK